jgi:hypothetical protein
VATIDLDELKAAIQRVLNPIQNNDPGYRLIQPSGRFVLERLLEELERKK